MTVNGVTAGAGRSQMSRAMAVFPIYGRFVGDFTAHLVSVDTEDTMNEVGAKIAAHAVGRRLPHESKAAGYEVLLDGRVVAASFRLKDVAVRPLQWFDVRWKW
jgi:toluene monooxygenase system protein B